jgi:type 1 glutamine amidotransferase
VKETGEKSAAFETTATADCASVTKDNLKNYDAVMFNTTGELPMTVEQKKDYLYFVRSAHGFVGVHTTTDTFYTWAEFGELIGGYFNGHP